MTEWRLFRGWSEDELALRLADLGSLRRNFGEADPAEMTAERGWRRVRSEAVIARESPGPPEPGGAYERARRAVADFRFSDPRIVEAHFDPGAPLHGRRMLLELEALGIRYLCGTVVTAVESGDGDGHTTFGYRYDTLEGHIERGVEWFRLVKEHATGEVRFTIDAWWRPGDFPNAWSRLGFTLLGPIHQEMWHRRAHWRLHHLAASVAPPPGRGRRLRHEGPTVGFAAGAAQAPLGRRATLATATALGAMTGVRSTSALALWPQRARRAAVPPARAPRIACSTGRRPGCCCRSPAAPGWPPPPAPPSPNGTASRRWLPLSPRPPQRSPAPSPPPGCGPRPGRGCRFPTPCSAWPRTRGWWRRR